MPADCSACIHCSGSNCVGLKTFGSAAPSPHSPSIKVLGPKWMMAPISKSCHSTCCGEGFRSEKFCARMGARTKPRMHSTQTGSAKYRDICEWRQSEVAQHITFISQNRRRLSPEPHSAFHFLESGVSVNRFQVL